MYEIPLIKDAFINQEDTKQDLAYFILNTDKFSMDKNCRDFEKEFSKYQKRKFSVLINSGASANLCLLQALKNLGRLKENDNIAFSGLTWSTNVMPIIQLEFNPIPIDCKKETLNIDEDDFKIKIKKYKLKCLFITNALGFTSELYQIRDICKRNNIILLEDNCESLGTELYDIDSWGLIDVKKAGNFGLASTFSFFVAHHLSTIEGGMICTDDEELYEMLLMVRSNGWDRDSSVEIRVNNKVKYNIDHFKDKYTFYDLGFNIRPTEITGRLGIIQLKYLEEIINKREKNYFEFEKAIINNNDLITLNRTYIKKLSSFALPIVCHTEELRNKYFKRFKDANIEIRPMIAGNITQQPFWKKYIKKNYKLQGVEFLDKCSFYCGNYPQMTSDELDIIIECINN